MKESAIEVVQTFLGNFTECDQKDYDGISKSCAKAFSLLDIGQIVFKLKSVDYIFIKLYDTILLGLIPTGSGDDIIKVYKYEDIHFYLTEERKIYRDRNKEHVKEIVMSYIYDCVTETDEYWEMREEVETYFNKLIGDNCEG